MVDYIVQGLLALCVIVLIGLVGYLVFEMIWGEAEPDFRAACEDVGASYEVIGTEFSPALKMNVDIYGCVK